MLMMSSGWLNEKKNVMGTSQMENEILWPFHSHHLTKAKSAP